MKTCNFLPCTSELWLDFERQDPLNCFRVWTLEVGLLHEVWSLDHWLDPYHLALLTVIHNLVHHLRVLGYLVAET